MKALDYVWFPWTVSKYLWEKIRPQKPQQPGRPPQLSCYGSALPLAYGKVRLTLNMLHWYFEPSVVRVSALFAMCEGPISGVDRVWKDKDLRGSPGEWGLGIITGTRPTQDGWTMLPTAQRLGYPGIAALTFSGLRSAAAQIGQMSFEVRALLHGTGGSDGDAHPADILKGTPASPASSMLCRTDIGAAFPFPVITDVGLDGTAFSSYRNYVQAEGLWLSPAFTDQRPAAEHLSDILQSTNATALWRSGALWIVPLGDRPVTGNGATYYPPHWDVGEGAIVPRYAIEPGDYATTEDRFSVSLPPESDAFNVCPVEFLERAPAASAEDPAYAYNVSLVDAPDPVDVARRGERRAPAVALHSICLRDVATKISRIRAQRLVRSRARYTFKLPWRYCRLEPLDFVTLTDPTFGLEDTPARILEIEEEPIGGVRTLTVTCEEWPYGIGTAAAHLTSSSDSAFPAEATYNAEARIVETAVASLTPVAMTTGYGDAQLFGVARGADRYVAVGSSAIPPVPAFARSFNGFTWESGDYTELPTAIGGLAQWMSVASDGGSLFVAVGNKTDDTPIAAVTDDGTTWAAGTMPAGDWADVTWSQRLELFVAVGYGVCATSPDGFTWMARTIPGYNWRRVLDNGTNLVAVGYGGGGATSTNGVDWTARSMALAKDYVGVAFGNDMWCALATDGSVVRSFDGGVTWASAGTAGTSYAGTGFYDMTFADVIFVTVGYDDQNRQTFSTSRDGVTWTGKRPPAGTWHRVIAPARCLLAVGGWSQSANVARSIEW